MRKALTIISCIIGLILIIGVFFAVFGGSGSMERMTTISGVYSVCKPNGYPAVCFANKSGGGFSCIPYSGECK